MKKPVNEMIDTPIEGLRRKLLLEQHNRTYESLRADPVLWRRELEERAIWDVALADGLNDEDHETP